MENSGFLKTRFLKTFDEQISRPKNVIKCSALVCCFYEYRVLFFSTEKLVSKVVTESERTGRNSYTQFRTSSKSSYEIFIFCLKSMMSLGWNCEVRYFLGSN